MFLFSRIERGYGRLAVTLALAVLFSVSSGVVARAAGTTGTISGTVSDAKSGLPVAGVDVNAVSPSGRSTTKTDAKGFYSFTGLSPDSYTISFQSKDYEPTNLTGVNVFPDGTATVNQKLMKSLSTIAHVSSRGPGGAYQPTQTNDNYTVTSDQIQTIQGKDNNTNEVSLLTSLPGASLDSSGYPVLRGGRENEEGYQFDGISIVDSFTNQFQNSLSVNGINNFQLTPGAGNASNGNAGTGTINYTAKRGTYPASGSIEADIASFPYQHQLELSYGIASQDGHISNYFSYIGQRDGAQYGPSGLPAVDNGEFYGTGAFTEDNLVDNFIFKFGKNKDTELQLLYQNQVDFFQESYGAIPYGGYANELLPTLSDPYYTQVASYPSLLTQYLGIPSSGLADVFAALPGHSNTQPYGYDGIYQPENVYKVQISHNFGSSAFLRAAYYGVNAVTTFDLPDPGDNVYVLQGSLKHGASLDFTDQLGKANLLQVGTAYAYNHPVFLEDSQSFAALAAGLSFIGSGSQGFEIADFLPNDTACQSAVAALGGTGTCGTLLAEKPGAKLPLYDQNAEFDRADYSVYFTDQFTPNEHLRIEPGLRLDANDTKYPDFINGGPTNVPNDTRYPKILQPRLAAALQLSKNDAIRASYARSTQFPPLGDASFTVNRQEFTQFDNFPSYNVLTNAPATFCGPKGDALCPNYGEQLYSEYQAVTGPAVQPIKPETFSNFDFSYSHQFPRTSP